MPRKRKFELVRCVYFTWRLVSRQGTFYGDGRSNMPNLGRHSLATTDRAEALTALAQLDRVKAEDLGLAPRSCRSDDQSAPLLLAEGRKLYENYIARPLSTGGVMPSTRRRYRTVFDKFLEFAAAKNISAWNAVTKETLYAYATHLQARGYAHKSQINELTVLKQAIKVLVELGHLKGTTPIIMKLKKAESQPAYCWRPDEVRAMVEHCSANPDLRSLEEVIVALACTGLRIAELASLKWSDLNLETGHLSLTDERGYGDCGSGKRRQLKSGRSRSFPIHPDLLQVLKKMSRRGPYVFYGDRGGRLKPDTVRRQFVKEVIEPLGKQFPTLEDEQGFADGRFHSFRHYFCSTCANSGVPERVVMDWLGHSDSQMIRIYYHLHDQESRRQMSGLNFLGGACGRSAGQDVSHTEEVVEPTT